MNTYNKTGRILLSIGTILLCIIFGGSLFDLLVNEGNVTKENYPDSLMLIRQFWIIKNPGDFFKPFTPTFTLIFIISVILYWKNKPTRTRLLLAFLCFFIVQLITFTYYFPQNEIIRTGSADELNKIKEAYFGTRFYLDILRNILSLSACIFMVSALTVKKQ